MVAWKEYPRHVCTERVTVFGLYKEILLINKRQAGHACALFLLLIYKWKNYFYEMKGDVGMSRHEKEREQEDGYTKRESHS